MAYLPVAVMKGRNYQWYWLSERQDVTHFSVLCYCPVTSNNIILAFPGCSTV